MKSKILLIMLFALLIGGLASAATVANLTITKPTLNGSYNKNLDVTFTILDANRFKRFDINLYYSTTAGAFTTKIASDSNLLSGASEGFTCDSNNPAATITCHYAWNITSLTAGGKYYVDINLMEATNQAVIADINSQVTSSGAFYANTTRIDSGGVCSLLSVFAIIIAVILILGAVFLFWGLSKSSNFGQDIMGVVVAGVIAVIGIMLFLALYNFFCY